MPSENANFLAATKYLKDCKYSVIPVGKNKKSLIKWEEYQKRLPTEQEIIDWWAKFPEANVGIVTGLISGLVVIDIDDPIVGKEALKELIPDNLVFNVEVGEADYNHKNTGIASRLIAPLESFMSKMNFNVEFLKKRLP